MTAREQHPDAAEATAADAAVAAGVVSGLPGQRRPGGPSPTPAGAPNELETLFRLAFDESPTGMALVEVDAATPEAPIRVIRVNRALTTLTGAEAPDADRAETAPHLDRIVHRDDVPGLHRLITASTADGGRALASEVRLRPTANASGALRSTWVHAATAGPDSTGDQSGVATTRVVLHFVDVSQLRTTEAELQRLAMSDSVTGLSNRTALEVKAGQALRNLPEEDATSGGIGLVLLDVDRFKTINDSLGHQAGDALLIEIARRLRTAVPHSSTVARLGGDEFAVLVNPCRSPRALVDLADRLRLRLTHPYTLPGAARQNATASFGVTWCDNAAHTMEDLYREADLALYEAKGTGRNAVALFDDALRSRADGRIEQERRLRDALAQDGVRMLLQPVVELAGGTVAGSEALARLEHPEYGILMPQDFIAVAEDTGLVVEIDSRITELAVAALSRTSDDPRLARIAVNVSPRTLDHAEYRARLSSALRRYGIDASRLLVEVTESSLLDADGPRADELRVLQGEGIQVGIDDFGTGYSALAYLDHFDLDFLKIDRSFVSRLGTGRRADAVVSAIINLAHAHGMVVTAEGVEDADQARRLRDMGCDRGQGWHFGRPAAPPV